MAPHFVHLHVHSNYSMCWGANTIDHLCAAARDRGFSHLALTDTNGLYGLGWFLESANRYNICPIIGSYLKTRDEQCVMLAKNHCGYGFLCHTISRVQENENFDLGTFVAEKGHDIVVLSQEVNLLRKLCHTKPGFDFYAEIVPYINNHKLRQYAKYQSIATVASNNVYLINKTDYKIHKLLRAIDLNTTLDRTPDSELVDKNATLLTAEEMSHFFPNDKTALENTLKIAKECSFNFDFKNYIFPTFQGPNGEDANSYLLEQVNQGIIWRYGSLSEKVKRRRDYELSIITEKGFAPYFLVVTDIISKAPRTCGRGSAASSLVSYCLGITHVDPIKYDLFFERFLNPGRVDPPDIDVDFPWDERDDILDYIFQKYGSNCSAMIANHNSFKVRSAVREIAKVYGLPDNEISQITKKMSGFWQPDNIWQLTQTHPVYKGTELNDPWPEIIEKAEKIRGYPRHLSIHCGGVVIAPDGLHNYVPTQPAKKILQKAKVLEQSEELSKDSLNNSKVNVVQWEKDQSEEFKLIKIDILGNRSLAVIRDALKSIEKNYGTIIDYATWNPLKDNKTISLLARGETIGVFYVESPAMRLLQQKTKKGDFESVVIHSSIIRPAANEFINEYIRRSQGGQFEYLHPLLEEILKETFGIMVYQEDVSKVVMALADFTPAEADDLRKIISKKHKQKKVWHYREQFFAGAHKKDIDKSICDQIWNMIMSFSGYSFCKPHSASYAMVSFKSAFLRAHYPAEFMAAVISNQGGYYSTFAYISEARRMDLKILMPDINKSQKQYTGYSNEIQIGLVQLKGLSRRSMDIVISERKKNGPFQSFNDFLERTRLDPSDIAIFIKSGCFDSVEPRRSRALLLWSAKMQHSAQKKSDNGTMSMFEQNQYPPEKTPKIQEYDKKTQLQHEIATLGFIASQHPLQLYNDQLKNIRYIQAKDMHKFVNKEVKMIGWFITGKVASTKDQKLMEFISFEDTTAIYETTFFPKTFNKFVHLVSRTRAYILEGIVESHYGAVTLNVQHVNYL